MVHKYWRVKFFTNNGSAVTSVAELQMRATPGGADQCTGGTASASTEFNGTLTAAKAFDDTLTGDSFWASNGAYVDGQWLRYEFATPVEVQEIALFERVGEATQAPRSGAVEWSDDGSAWTQAWTWSTYGWRSVSDGRVFTNPAYFSVPTTTHWRMAVLTNGGSAATALTEMQMRTSLSGADQCTGGTAFTNDTASYPSLTAANAFDDDTGTLWAIGGSVAGTLGYVFASAKRIVEVALTERSGNSDQPPRSGNIEYSTDSGASWGVAFTFSTGAWAGTLETRVFSDPDYVPSSEEILVEVYQGVTLVAARTLDALTGTETDYAFALTGPELALVTDPSAVTLRLTYSGSTPVRVTAAQLQFTGELSGTAYAKAVEGVLTVTALVPRQTRRTILAAMTMAGAVTRRTARLVMAASSTVATLLRQARRPLGASATGSAGIIPRTGRPVLASVAGATTLVERTARGLAATVTAAATSIEHITRALAAALTAAGAVGRETRRSVTASLTASTTLAVLRVLLRTITSTLTGAAGLGRAVRVGRSASLTLTATVGRLLALTRLMTASLTVSRDLRVRATARLQAAVTATTAVSERLGLLVVAAVVAAALVRREIRYRLAASLSVTAVTTRLQGLQQLVTATLTGAATLRTQSQRLVTAVLAVTAGAGRQLGRRASGTLTGVSGLLRETRRRVLGSLTVTATAIGQQSVQRLVTAAITATATVQGRVGRVVAAVLGVTAQQGRQTRVIRGAQVVGGGAAVQQPQQPLGGSILAGVTLMRARSVYAALAASVTGSAMVRGMGQLLRAAVLAVYGIIEFVNEWSGLLRPVATLTTRYEAEHSLSSDLPAQIIQTRLNPAATLASRTTSAQIRDSVTPTATLPSAPGAGTLSS